jgi:pyruvate/2-oxoglutarate dehydrogenase complex dihydrolipoamide dehydrogenase (E3) component
MIEAAYEVIVVGGGKGGKTLAIDLGHKGIRTALIERSPEMIGGSCINVACIPTKTLIASARVARTARLAAKFGIQTGEVRVDWPVVRRRAEAVVAAMRAMNHKNLTSAPSLDFILGTARFEGPGRVAVRDVNGSERILSAEKIFINTGTRPAEPKLPGFAGSGGLNSEQIQRLDVLPRHLVILGGSYVALEFAQMFRLFGSAVTIVARSPQLLKREDPDVTEALSALLKEEGITLELGAQVTGLDQANDETSVTLSGPQGGTRKLVGSHVLAAFGRTPNTEDLNLGVAGVASDARGFVKVNDRLETTARGVWALGDVNGGPQFTHASLDDYRIVKANVFAGGARTSRDRLVPFTLFTDPELARVGMTEMEARERGFSVRIEKMPVAAIPRAKTASETRGLIKIVIDQKTDHVLGCTILSVQAGEMIAAAQMTMIAGLPFTALRDTIWSHPTMVEGFNTLFGA